MHIIVLLLSHETEKNIVVSSCYLSKEEEEAEKNNLHFLLPEIKRNHSQPSSKTKNCKLK